MNKTKNTLLCGLAALAMLPQLATAQTASTASPQDIPYSDTWSSWKTEIDSKVWTVEDKNGDNATWGTDLGVGNYVVYSGVGQQGAANDWLVSPPLRLEAGKSYKLASSAAMSGGTQTIAVAFGTSNDPSDYTTFIQPMSVTASTASVMLGGKLTAIEGTFTAPATGNYRIGFHALTEAAGGYLLLGPVNVTETAAEGGKPTPVTDLTVTPGANGELSATVAFTVPTEDVLGNPLTSISSVQVTRDFGYTPVYTLDNPTPGQRVEWTDRTVGDETHTYTVVTRANDTRSDEVSVEAWIGVDIPAAPKNIRVHDNLDGTATVSWDPVTEGEHGGYVGLSNVTYTVMPYISGYANDPVAQDISATSCRVGASYAGAQTALFYAVGAASSTTSGESYNSELGYSDYFFNGTPTAIPFEESFANRQLRTGIWGPSYNDTRNHFGFSADAADNDGGALMFSPAEGGDQAMIGSPKIDLTTATNPTLTFQYYASSLDKQSKIRVYNFVNGQEEKLVATIDFADFDGTSGWQRVTCNLTDPALKQTNGYTRIIFRTEAYSAIRIDDVRVQDMVAHNIEATMTAPANVQPGDELKLDVTVRNIGSEDAENFNVNLYVDGKVAQTQDGDYLEVGETRVYPFTLTAPVSASSFTLKAEAAWAQDESLSDNVTAEQTVNVATSPLPGVNDLRASNGSAVKLDWSPANATAPTITESFETYQPFAMDADGKLTSQVGQWKLVDKDNGLTYTWNRSSGLSFPGMGSAFAYTVFNVHEMSIDLTEDYRNQFYNLMAAHTGNQMMMSNGVTIDQNIANNDWLISPRLSGEAQTITFWVKAPLCDNANQGPESFQVWTSDFDDDPDNFTQVKGGEANQNWQQVSVDVDEGIYYVAIQRTSTGGLSSYDLEPSWFAVDDVTYQSAPLTIVGYQVYRDNQLIATTDANTTTYNDPDGKTESRYTVIVNYQEGKSAPSNTATLDPTGIEAIGAAGAQKTDNNWYDLQGRRVSQPTQHGIYIHQGKKYVK